jgi:hypothetical protein
MIRFEYRPMYLLVSGVCGIVSHFFTTTKTSYLRTIHVYIGIVAHSAIDGGSVVRCSGGNRHGGKR